MDFQHYRNLDALALAELVRTGQVTASELLQIASDALQAGDRRYTLLNWLDQHNARYDLEHLKADRIFSGVPFLVKDLMLPVSGAPLTNGSRAMRDFTPETDGLMAELFRACGLIMLGKTTTSELGCKPLCVSKLSGPTRNPWNTDLNSGGSSGGSTVAVAAGIVPMAYSSDGGGSIRLPAAWCGVFGFKPGRGLNRFEDMTQAWGGAVVSHVTTRSVRDSAAYLDLVSAVPGADRGEHFTRPVEGSCLQRITRPPQGLKIALITESPIGSPVSEEALNATRAAAELCTSLGHHVEPVSSWPFDGMALMKAFVTQLLHFTCRDVEAIAFTLGQRAEKLPFELQTRFMAQAGSGLALDRLSEARALWQQATEAMQTLHQEYDIVLTPAAACAATDHKALEPGLFESLIMRLKVKTGLARQAAADQALEKAVLKNFSLSPFTAIANISGQPAMSVPLHQGVDGLPYGAHFMAGCGQDHLLMALAKQLEDAAPWQQRRPDFTP